MKEKNYEVSLKIVKEIKISVQSTSNDDALKSIEDVVQHQKRTLTLRHAFVSTERWNRIKEKCIRPCTADSQAK